MFSFVYNKKASPLFLIINGYFDKYTLIYWIQESYP